MKEWFKDLDRAKALWNLSYCIFLCSFIAYAVVDIFVNMPDKLLVASAGLATVIALAGFFYANKYSALVKGIFAKHPRELGSISAPMAHIRKATPGQSLIKQFQIRRIKLNEISKMYLQTGALCDEYLAKSFIPQIVSVADELDSVQLICAGFGSEADCKKFNDIFEAYEVPNITMQCVLTSEHLTKHFNIIEMKDGRMFTWFEPEHKTPPVDKPPSYGAFLSKVFDGKRSEALDIYNSCLA